MEKIYPPNKDGDLEMFFDQDCWKGSSMPTPLKLVFAKVGLEVNMDTAKRMKHKKKHYHQTLVEACAQNMTPMDPFQVILDSVSPEMRVTMESAMHGKNLCMKDLSYMRSSAFPQFVAGPPENITYMPSESGATISKEVLPNGCLLFWIRPTRPFDKNNRVLVVHGGGFMTGCFGTGRMITQKIALTLNVAVAFIQYRLVPEFTVSDQVDDVLCAYRRMLIPDEGAGVPNVALFGDSAGGCISLLFLERLKLAKRPSSTILISPVTDFSRCGNSHVENIKLDCIVQQDFMAWVYEETLNAERRVSKNPMVDISPLLHDFPGEVYGNVLFSAASNEVLRDDAFLLYQKILAKNTHQVYNRHDELGLFNASFSSRLAFHCYQLGWSRITESANELQHIFDFMVHHFK